MCIVGLLQVVAHSHYFFERRVGVKEKSCYDEYGMMTLEWATNGVQWVMGAKPEQRWPKTSSTLTQEREKRVD